MKYKNKSKLVVNDILCLLSLEGPDKIFLNPSLQTKLKYILTQILDNLNTN